MRPELQTGSLSEHGLISSQAQPGILSYSSTNSSIADQPLSPPPARQVIRCEPSPPQSPQFRPDRMGPGERRADRVGPGERQDRVGPERIGPCERTDGIVAAGDRTERMKAGERPTQAQLRSNHVDASMPEYYASQSERVLGTAGVERVGVPNEVIPASAGAVGAMDAMGSVAERGLLDMGMHSLPRPTLGSTCRDTPPSVGSLKKRSKFGSLGKLFGKNKDHTGVGLTG